MTNLDTTHLEEQSAVERADALLTRWGQSLRSAERRMPAENAVSGDAPISGDAEDRADSILERIGQNLSGRQLVKAAAHGYVVLAAKTGMLIEPLVTTWQDGVAEAQRQQEQQAAQTQGTSGAHQEEASEKEGQQTLKTTAGAAVEAAGTAAGA